MPHSLNDLVADQGRLWVEAIPRTLMRSKQNKHRYYDPVERKWIVDRGVKEVIKAWPQLTDSRDPIIDPNATSFELDSVDKETKQRIKELLPTRTSKKNGNPGSEGNGHSALGILGASLAVLNAEEEDARQIAEAIAEICESLRDLPAEQRTVDQAPERVRKSVNLLKRERRLREKFLASLLEKQGGHCALRLETCASIAVNYRPLAWSEVQVDHLIALALGGGDDMSNLQAVCPNCHFSKTAEDVQKICRPCGPPAKRARAE